MSTTTLEKRVRALEAEVARLRGKIEVHSSSTRPWWEEIGGAFANDPAFKEAMRLGRKYRQSLRPKGSRRRKRPNAGA